MWIVSSISCIFHRSPSSNICHIYFNNFIIHFLFSSIISLIISFYEKVCSRKVFFPIIIVLQYILFVFITRYYYMTWWMYGYSSIIYNRSTLTEKLASKYLTDAMNLNIKFYDWIAKKKTRYAFMTTKTIFLLHC